jgi:alkylation response protein AidB-like acyl-CoA dehydrogenase
MDTKLTDEQAQLLQGAQRFMDKECPAEFVRTMEASELGFSRQMWQQMAEMGWLGINLPTEWGGLGMGTVDLMILMRELGRHICPSPFLSTAVIAGEAIARAGTDAQRQRYIEQIVAGELIVAFAYQEFTRKFDPGAITVEALLADGHYVLNGTKMFVEYAAGADMLLVVARTSGKAPGTSGLTMFLVDAKTDGIEYTHTPTMDRGRHYDVTFSGVRVPRENVLGRVDDAWTDMEPALHKAALAFSAFTNGACFQLHEQSTQFAKERVQFGRPIGQMQTIQGYLAQLIMEILGSDMLTMFTAFNMDRDRPVRGYVAKAKAFSAETVGRTMDIGSQIFGGMGYMEEVDSTLYLRRGKQYQLMLGGTDYWYDIVAEEMIDVENPVELT